MGDAVKSLIDNLELITDCCRYSEGLLPEAAVRKKYRFDDATWERLGKDDQLVEAIELEKVRRVRSGAAKREKAQSLIVQAVDILGQIALDDNANARHRIDATKALDTLADPGPTHAPDSGERYRIIINLGNDRHVIDKQIRPVAPGENVEILEPADDANTAPLLAMIAANKRTDDGNGEPSLSGSTKDDHRPKRRASNRAAPLHCC